MQQLMKEHDIPYSTLDNENVRDLLVYMDAHPDKAGDICNEKEEEKKEKPQPKYAL